MKRRPPTIPGEHISKTDWPRFLVGAFLLVIAVGFSIWGFSKTTLSTDQRQILLWILPLASGFSATAFAGSLAVKARGFWPGLVISATGGFGVWLLTFFFLFPKSQESGSLEQNLKLSDFLTPGNDPTPKFLIPPNKPESFPDGAVSVAKGEVVVFLGGVAVSTMESSFVVLRLYGKDLLTISKSKEGLALSADVWDADGKISATIENNRFRVNPNNTLPLLRPDPHTLVVENERKIKVLEVRFLNESAIKVEGVFRSDGRYSVVAKNDEISFGPLLVKGGIAFHIKGKALFEWPGRFGNSKKFLAPTDSIAPNSAVLGFAVNGGAINLVLKDSAGEEYSIMQIGGDEVPEGTELFPAISFQLRASGTY